MIEIGLAGVGAWGRNLLRNVGANPRCRLAALADADPAALASAGRSYPEAESFESFEELVQVAGLDAVVIATPARDHFAQARRAIERGLHVLVEKPMCMTTAEAHELVALARARRRVLMVGHTFLYSNLVHEVKRRITSGELGEIQCLYSQRLNLGRVRNDVDALWNFAPHDISIACYLLDQWPTHVNARGASFVQKAEQIADVAFFQMDFARGQLVGGHVSWLDPQKVRRMVVVGSEKMLVYDDVDTQQPIQVYDKSVELEFQASPTDFSDFQTKTRAGDLVVPSIRLVEPLRVEIDHFVGCVVEDAMPLTDGNNGLRVVSVLEAMTHSLKAGGAQTIVDYGEPIVDGSMEEPTDRVVGWQTADGPVSTTPAQIP